MRRPQARGAWGRLAAVLTALLLWWSTPVGAQAYAEVVPGALEQTIKGRRVDSHELTVEVIAANGPIRSCHLLYVSGLGRDRSAQLLESLKDASILTVSDGDQFAAMGGVAQLILENDRMRFAVNVKAAQRARLKISSKLLSLAKIIKDQPDGQR